MGWMEFGKELFMGGISGYITNNYAVKMLFRQYGPFGGVILKTKDQFIDKISKLVERDIITRNTLEPELSGDAFKNIMTIIVGEIIHQTLIEKTPDISFGKIPGFEEFTARLTTFVDIHQKETITQLQSSIFSNTPLDALVSEIQAKRLSKEIMRLVLATFREQELIATTIKEFYRENQTIPLSEYLNKRIIQQIITNFKTQTMNIHQQIEGNYNPLIDETFDRFYDIFEMDRVFTKVESSLKQKRLVDFIGYQNTEVISREIINHLAGILKSSEGRALIANVTESIINHLANQRSSIIDLLNPEVQEKVRLFIYHEFPYLLDQFKNWIENNKTGIEALIDQSVDEVLDEGAKGLFNIVGKLKKLLKELLVRYHVASRFSVVQRVAAALEDNPTLPAHGSERVAARLYEFLKSTSIGEIVSLLRTRGLIRTEHITSIIYQNVDHYIHQIDPAIFNDWYETRLGEIVHADLKQIMAEYSRNTLYQWIKKDFLYSEKFTRLFHSEINKIVEHSCEQKISEIIHPDDVERISINIEKELLQKAEAEKEHWQKRIEDALIKFGKGKQLTDIIDDKMQESLATEVSGVFSAGLKEKLSDIKYTDLRTVYQKIQSVPNIETKLSEIVVKITADNIDALLKGNIEGSVKRSLTALPEQGIQKTIEDFMGRELKPINILGAILGAVFGVGTFLTKEAFFPGHYFFSLGISIGVCALVGWLTNVIAIRMLFRPYKRWRVMGINVPFTPGVVAKQQARFASNMANFVDKTLLNPETVARLFEERSEEMQRKVLASISEDDYRLLGEILGKNSDEITKAVVGMAERLIDQNRAKIVDMLVEYLKKLDLSVMDFSDIVAKGQIEIMERIKNLDGFIYHRLQSIIDQDQTIAKMLPPFAKGLIREFMETKTEASLDLILNVLSDRSRMEKMINSLSPNFNEVIDKSLSELMSPAEQEKIKNQVTLSIMERLNAPSSRQQLYFYLNEKFLVEFSGEKQIGQLFDGRVIGVLRDNAGFITDHINTYIKDALRDGKSEIAEIVSKQVSAAMGGWSFVGKWVNIDGDIQRIVNRLIDTKLPGFLNDKSDEIERIMVRIINEKIARCRVSDLGFTLEADAMVNTIASILKDPPVVTSIMHLSNRLVEVIFEIKIKKYLSLISVKDLKDFTRILEEEISIVTHELGNTLLNPGRRQQILIEFMEGLDKILDGLIYAIKVKDLMAEIDPDSFQISAKRLLTRMAGSEGLNRQLSGFLRRLAEKVQYQRPDELLDFNELRSSLIFILENMVTTDGFHPEITERLSAKVQLLINETNRILPAEMKDFAAVLILGSFLEALRGHFFELISAINFERVTEEVVRTMRPQEIEAMFYSFADKYFKQLEAYGLWGGVLGVLSLVG